MEDLRMKVAGVLMTPNQSWRGMKKVPIELIWGLEELINKEVVKARIDLIKKLDNSVPNFWKTNQTEYTHQDMQNLLDLMAQELADTESNKEGVRDE